MAFRVGQKVVCIDDENFARLDIVSDLPRKGRVYTVAWYGCRPTDLGVPGVFLRELKSGICPTHKVTVAWRATRFRPVVERKTDISIFTAMLSPSRETVSG